MTHGRCRRTLVSEPRDGQPFREIRYSAIGLRCYACPRRVFHGQVLRHEPAGTLDNTTIESTCYHKHSSRALALRCASMAARAATRVAA